MRKNRSIAIIVVMVFAASRGYAQSSDWLSKDITSLSAGISAGYANIQARFVNSDGSSNYGSGIWGESDDRLHGIYFGMSLQFHITGGLSVYSGLLTEVYLSFDNSDSYSEIALSLPLHLQFALPLSDEFVVGVHTGPGANLALLGALEQDAYETYYPFNNGYKRFGATYDLGFFMQYEVFRLDFIWQQSITQWTSDAYRNRFAVGLTYFME